MDRGPPAPKNLPFHGLPMGSFNMRLPLPINLTPLLKSHLPQLPSHPPALLKLEPCPPQIPHPSVLGPPRWRPLRPGPPQSPGEQVPQVRGPPRPPARGCPRLGPPPSSRRTGPPGPEPLLPHPPPPSWPISRAASPGPASGDSPSSWRTPSPRA